MALAMIEGAERSGRLQPGQTVVEYTGGSTGSSLAFVCAVKGYKLRIVTSDAFAAEKLRTMRAFGAELEVIPSPDGITPRPHPPHDATRRPRSWAKSTVSPQTSSTTGHGRRLRRARRASSLEQLEGRVDAFCAYVGTAGCFLGVTGALRARCPTCSG